MSLKLNWTLTAKMLQLLGQKHRDSMLTVPACFSLLFLNPDDKLIVKINNPSSGRRWSIMHHQKQPGWKPVTLVDTDRRQHLLLTFLRGLKASSRSMLHPPRWF